jgi:hypothetical protein
MRVKDLVEELSLFDEDAEVFIEVKDHWVPVTDVAEDSQGVYLENDPDFEEREMR